MTDRMTPTEPVDARLARLRDATATITPSAAFAERVLAAATASPRRRRDAVVGVWWSVPIAALVAAAAVLWALRTRRPTDDGAARDVEAALGLPDGEVGP